VQATVIKHTGSHYLLSCLPEWKPIPAVMRGKVRLLKSTATNPIAVGDRVVFDLPTDPSGAAIPATEENPALIREILPRSNYVIRKSTNLSRQAHIIASNVERAFIIVTLAFPEVKLPFLDRLLVTCEVYGIPATIVLNKVDMLEDFDYSFFRDIYAPAGYPIIETCALTGRGIEELRAALSSGVNLLSGVSGVGKSSLIKALDPTLNPRTGEISLSHLQGKHTTTFYEMYPLSTGGYIIDTPGIRSFGLLDLEPAEIALHFPEMLKLSQQCRFSPCTHTHEPGCAVKKAVDEGLISPERYNSYLGMLQENDKYRAPQ